MSDIYGTYILDAIIVIGLMLYVRYAAPYITSMAKVNNFQFISDWVDRAVAAAEQKIQGSKMGEDKKKYVIELLLSMGIIVDDAVDALIEAAVKAMNAANDTLKDAAKNAIRNVDSDIIADKISDNIMDVIRNTVEDVVMAKTLTSKSKSKSS